METGRWIVLLCLSMDERADWTRDTSTAGDCHRVPNKSHRSNEKPFLRTSVHWTNQHTHTYTEWQESDCDYTIRQQYTQQADARTFHSQ